MDAWDALRLSTSRAVSYLTIIPDVCLPDSGLVVTLVLSQLDHGNAILAGILDQLHLYLQVLLNPATCSVAAFRHLDYITIMLANLHRLCAFEHIRFKPPLCYLSDDLHHIPDMPSTWNLQSVFACYSIYAIAGICYRPPVRLSVRRSVTQVDQSKSVEARITKFSPYSSPSL